MISKPKFKKRVFGSPPKELVEKYIKGNIAPEINGPYLPRREVEVKKKHLGNCCACKSKDKTNYKGPVDTCQQGWSLVYIMYEKTYILMSGGYADDMSDHPTRNPIRVWTDECPPDI